jgi:hypothetical protein
LKHSDKAGNGLCYLCLGKFLSVDLSIDVAELVVVVLPTDATKCGVFGRFGHIDLFLFLFHLLNCIDMKIAVIIQIIVACRPLKVLITVLQLIILQAIIIVMITS